MASVLLTAEFEAEEGDLDAIMNAVFSALGERNPHFGLEVDGEHRDPDEPLTDLFG